MFIINFWLNVYFTQDGDDLDIYPQDVMIIIGCKNAKRRKIIFDQLHSTSGIIMLEVIR